jgi:hypothetical protein
MSLLGHESLDLGLKSPDRGLQVLGLFSLRPGRDGDGKSMRVVVIRMHTVSVAQATDQSTSTDPSGSRVPRGESLVAAGWLPRLSEIS